MSAFSWNKVLKDEEGGKQDAAAEAPPVHVPGLNEPAKYEPQSGHNIVLDDKYKDNQEPSEVRENAEAVPIADAHIDEILRMAVERKASAIHLTPGLPPMDRIDGDDVPL